MLATTQLQNTALRILLADPDYNEYLLFKNLLAPDADLTVSLLWCGEVDRICSALRSGFYDVVLMCCCDENIAALEAAMHEGCVTQVVMLDDELVDHIVPSCARVLGVLDRRHPECNALKYFLRCAGAQDGRAGGSSRLQ